MHLYCISKFFIRSISEVSNLELQSKSNVLNLMLTAGNFHSCINFTAERDNLMKCHKEELTAAERQGKTHVLSRLPRLHQDQLAELNTRHAQETENTHLFIQNVLDQKVHIVALKILSSTCMTWDVNDETKVRLLKVAAIKPPESHFNVSCVNCTCPVCYVFCSNCMSFTYCS